MTTQSGPVFLYLISGVLLCILGALVAKYPEASYAIRTAWKHDDVSVSERGLTDQRLMGVVTVVIGLGILGLGFTLF